ncbi:MAG: Gfo/Idh/MocA family oxidoreductase [Planctomycetota bacterium]
MSQLRLAVIGAGHLGKIHVRLLKQIENVELVGVAEPSPMAQREVIDQFDVDVVSDYRKLIDQIDAAVIATPTRFHFRIARDLLRAGVHVLVEKPLTDSVGDARTLQRIARETGCVAAVGHVERFNPAIQAALKLVGEPRFVQAARMSGFTFRSTDIGVVHDLMIHDIDLVNSVFPGQVASVAATGVSVIGEPEDIAQASIQFSCGGAANLTASRCSFQNERSFQIFGNQGYACVDLANSKVSFVEVPQWLADRKYNLLDTTPEQQAFIRDNLFTKILPKSEIDVPKCNAILEEQKDWIDAIESGAGPTVCVDQGAEAVAIAGQVIDGISRNQWNAPATIPMSGQTSSSMGIEPWLLQKTAENVNDAA